tara:strand:- start:8091 stop:8636 length:546 start_codon:yes stop_codon:yes gene_type:complete
MSLKILFGSIILSAVLVSCSSNEITEPIIKQRLAELNQLGTVEYDLSKVLILDDDYWLTIGERKALITAKANLIAGIDFKKIEILDFEPKSHIKVKLPKPKIILLNIPPEKIEFSVLKSSYLRSEFSNEELNEIQVLGEKDIRKKINDLGILDQASENGKIFLESWLKLLGFKTINIQTNE